MVALGERLRGGEEFVLQILGRGVIENEGAAMEHGWYVLLPTRGLCGWSGEAHRAERVGLEVACRYERSQNDISNRAVISPDMF